MSASRQDYLHVFVAFLKILGSGENCVWSSCLVAIFGGFFAVVGPFLHERCLSQVIPLCLVARNCTEGYECALCSNVHFCDFCNFCLFFPRTWCARWTGHAGKVCDQSCNRPSALWASQHVLSFPPLSSNSLSFLLFFSNFSSFQQRPVVFLHLLSLPAFSSIFCADMSLVTSLPTLCPARHLKQANATSAFLFRHFWDIQKRRSYLEEHQKSKVCNFQLSFFRGKSDVFKMGKRKNFEIRTLQHD